MGETIVLVLFTAAPVLIGSALFVLARRRRRSSGIVKNSWASLVSGNCLVLLFLLSLGLFAGEIYFRFCFDATDSVGYSLASQRWFKRHWKTNGNDSRDDIEYRRFIAPGKRRISFLGDSFTAGQGIKNIEDRFPNRIRARRSDWEIHIIAGLGWDTDKELFSLKYLVANHYQLDNVVLVYCLNDVFDLSPRMEDSLRSVGLEIRNAGWLVQNSYFVNFLYTRWKVMRNPATRGYFAFIGEGYQGEIWGKETKQLRELRDLVRSNGGKFMVVTFPFVNAVGPNYPYAAIHKQLDDFWKAENVPHLDLLSVYENEPASKLTVNRFDAHPNEHAHQLATDVIEKFIADNLRAIQK